MTTAVTGAAGLLGGHVVDALLAAGRDVRAVDLLAPPASGAEVVVADLTSLGEALQALHGVEAVVHSAAIPRPTGRTGTDVFRTNILTAYNVVEAAVLAGARRLVNASSVSVVGHPFNPRPLRPTYLPLDEDHPLAPQEAYGLSKLLTEEIVAAATRRSDLTAVSLRPPWIQTPASFHGDVAARRADPAVATANLWAYVDARDAAEAFLRALDVPATGHVSVYLTAPDTFMEQETPELVRAAFGEIELRTQLTGHEPLIDGTAAERLLGFRPTRSWRSYPAVVA